MARSRGRPSAYKPEYCEEIVSFFNVAPNREVIEHTYGKNDYEKESIKEVANDLPTLEGFAAKIGVHRETLNNWAEQHPDFFDAIKKCKALQEHILVTNGLKGLYSPAFAIFYATNVTPLKNQQHIDHTSKGDKLPAPQVYLPTDLPSDVVASPAAS